MAPGTITSLRSSVPRNRLALAISCACAAMLGLTSCSRGERLPDASATARINLATPHFIISSYGLDSAAVSALARYLEDHQARVVSDLGASSLGVTHVAIQSREEFDQQWATLIKASGIGFQPQALTGPDGTIYVYGPWARAHPGRALGQDAVHELAHAATRRTALDFVAKAGGDTIGFLANDSLGKRGRWLLESIATYEAGQATDLNRLGYLLRGRYPSIAMLNDPANGQIYDIGYRLTEFIVKTWGRDGLVRLIQQDANVQTALGISDAELMRRWFAYVQDRYLIIKPRWFGWG